MHFLQAGYMMAAFTNTKAAGSSSGGFVFFGPHDLLPMKRNTLAINSTNAETSQTEVGMVVCSIDLSTLEDGQNSQLVHLISVNANGMVTGVDGRQWKLNADNILANAANAKTDYPGDYHHASLTAKETGVEAPACGWVDPASLVGDENGISGMVEWTDKALNAIQSKEFKYISPVFTYNAGGETVAFKGFALTHYPNLGDLKPVTNAQDNPTLEEKYMDELLEQLRWMLNLPTASTPEEILGELKKLQERLQSHVSDDEAANAADLNTLETLANIETRLETLAANSQQDLTGYVPRSEFDTVRNELSAITTAAEDKRVETAVNSAIEAGKVSPANKTWAENLCRTNPESFDQFVANSAQAVPLGEDQHGGEGAQVLTDEETAVCSQLGLSAEDYIKTRKEEVN